MSKSEKTYNIYEVITFIVVFSVVLFLLWRVNVEEKGKVAVMNLYAYVWCQDQSYDVIISENTTLICHNETENDHRIIYQSNGERINQIIRCIQSEPIIETRHYSTGRYDSSENKIECISEQWDNVSFDVSSYTEWNSIEEYALSKGYSAIKNVYVISVPADITRGTFEGLKIEKSQKFDAPKI